MTISKNILATLGIFAMFSVFVAVLLGGTTTGQPEIPAIRAEFLLFALTLIGVAVFHHETFYVALVGLASLLLLKWCFVADFSLATHLYHEWRTLLNLLGLLLGFAILAKHFEESNVPEMLPRFLPDDWKGGFVLLIFIFVLSSFLDNIAAAMIGGTVALTVFKGRVDIGYLAAIVAASNAGGSGSVVGDTTTTMMWIDGVAALDVLHGYAAAFPALLIFGVIISKKQHRFQPIIRETLEVKPVNWLKIVAVVLILAGAIAANIMLDFPAAGVWAAILISALFTKTPWHEVPASMKGSLFLLSLVLCASLMPVEKLPEASLTSAFVLGVISAVFDNIPLTKLALEQGGYDWGVLAYTVGFGGSMIWFGSSAGVALTNMFPQGKSVGAWIKHGWAVPLAYVLGFLIMAFTVGWHPHAPHKDAPPAAVVQETSAH